MANSRSEYVVKNAATTVTIQLVKNLLDFVGRIIFVRILGAEYLGVNSLFTQILTVLSFAELGVGNAMIFSLYKPLAEKNQEKIKSLMRLYAISYRVIGAVIAVAGLYLIRKDLDVLLFSGFTWNEIKAATIKKQLLTQIDATLLGRYNKNLPHPFYGKKLVVNGNRIKKEELKPWLNTEIVINGNNVQITGLYKQSEKINEVC